MPFPFFGETRELDAAAREMAGGSYIALTDGITHYQTGGNEGGVPVVMIHGFSTPSFIFDTTFDFLAESGFRILRYDLFGRGTSDRPDVKYEVRLFVRQLKELIDALNFERINLIALSMGGPIAASFTDLYPKYVSKLVLIDPAGVRPLSFIWPLKIATLPGLGELLFGVLGGSGLVKTIAADLFTPQLVKQFQARYIVQTQYRGFMRSILSTIRNGMLDPFIETYARVGRLNIPTLLFWGRQDTTVPVGNSRKILSVIPQARLHIVENCGHIPHHEKPQEVNPVLLEFLKQ